MLGVGPVLVLALLSFAFDVTAPSGAVYPFAESQAVTMSTAAVATTASVLPYTPAVTSPHAAIINFAGRLLERGTRRPVPDAQVVLLPAGLMALTGQDGAFGFAEVPAGTYQVVVAAVGYQRLKTSETISEGERTDVVYYIEPDYGSPLEIVVEAEKIKKEVSKTTIRRDEIRKVPGTGNDAIKAVTVLPGVATSNEFATDLLIRGSGPFDNRIEIDRVPIPYVYHFGGLRSVVNSNLIESIDFQAGGFSALFGDATGGVLLANTRPGRKDRFGGVVDISTILSEGFLEGPVGENGSIIVAARRSYIDLLLGPIVRSQVPREQLQLQVFPQFYDYQVRADYRFVTGTTGHFFTYGSDDILKFFTGQASPRDPDLTGNFFIHNYFHTQGLALTRTHGAWTTNYRLFHIAQGQDIRIGVRENFLRTRTSAPGFNAEASLRASPRHAINIGSQSLFGVTRLTSFFPRPPRQWQTDFTFTDAEFVSTDRKIESAVVGLYAEDVIHARPDWLVVPGLRFDFLNQDRSYWYVDPRLTTRYEWNEKMALKGAIGRYSQFPTPQQLDRDFGNPALAPIHSYHYVAGFEHKLTSTDTLELQTYYKVLPNLVANNATGEQYRNNLRGRAYGFEIFYRHFMTDRWFGWASYAYSRSLRIFPEHSGWRPSGVDQPHIINVVMSYKLSSRWEAGFKWRYNSGEPYTPYPDRIYMADVAFYVPVPGELNSRRRPAAHRLDARLEYSYPFPTWIVRAYLEVLNVYASKNVAGFIDNYDYTRQEPLSILPYPVPAFGLRAEF